MTMVFMANPLIGQSSVFNAGGWWSWFGVVVDGDCSVTIFCEGKVTDSGV